MPAFAGFVVGNDSLFQESATGEFVEIWLAEAVPRDDYS